MKIKTGVDIIEVERIQQAIEKQGEIFLNTVYTPNEIAYCSNTGKMTYQHYAARFAAKEAIYKAISELIPATEDNILQKIEITNTKQGRPVANIQKLQIHQIESIDISLTHIQNYAVASVVVLEK